MYIVAKLAAEGLKHRSIKTYMAGVRHLHIEEGLGDPFMPVLARLHYVLRGVKHAQGEAGAGRRERLPITPPILRECGAGLLMTLTISCCGRCVVWPFSAS